MVCVTVVISFLLHQLENCRRLSYKQPVQGVAEHMFLWLSCNSLVLTAHHFIKENNEHHVCGCACVCLCPCVCSCFASVQWIFSKFNCSFDMFPLEWASAPITVQNHKRQNNQHARARKESKPARAPSQRHSLLGLCCFPIWLHIIQMQKNACMQMTWDIFI